MAGNEAQRLRVVAIIKRWLVITNTIDRFQCNNERCVFLFTDLCSARSVVEGMWKTRTAPLWKPQANTSLLGWQHTQLVPSPGERKSNS